jgi:hypothetical protein
MINPYNEKERNHEEIHVRLFNKPPSTYIEHRQAAEALLEETARKLIFNDTKAAQQLTQMAIAHLKLAEIKRLS